jgi:hypothetical protein|nr:HNH endonuclease [Ruthenibacterium lactatiformans]
MEKCESCKQELKVAQYALLNGNVYKSCPQCSSDSGDNHCFYKCPDDFGTTLKRVTVANPLGLQSYCARCRSNKKGPHEGRLLCNELVANGGYIISEIRFLPMSPTVFSTKDEVLTFLTETMPNRGYTYFYQRRRIDCPPNTLMLFQYHAELLGCAVFIKAVKFSNPQVLSDGNVYRGEYRFAPKSMILFDKPISADEFKTIDSTFSGFSQSARKMVPGLLPAIFSLIEENGMKRLQPVDAYFPLPEEIEYPETLLKEGVKKQVVVNAYERNPKARTQCIKHYKKQHNGRVVCEICGFDFGKVYGEEFKDKIHIHHIVELASIGEEYEVDPTTDLIPICPNCHLIAHSKAPAFTPDEIRDMLGIRK